MAEAVAASVAHDPAAGDWRHQLLAKMGAPPTDLNLASLTLWAASEGMPPEAHNWLATSLKLAPWHYRVPYSEPFYATTAQGVEATWRSLHLTPGAGYAAIIAAFVGHHGATAIWQAVNASKWCAGCTAGRYPGALRAAIDAGNVLGAAARTPAGATYPAPPPTEADHDYHRKVLQVGREHVHTAGHLAGGARALRGLLGSRTTP